MFKTSKLLDLGNFNCHPYPPTHIFFYEILIRNI